MSPVLVVGDVMVDVLTIHQGPVARGSDTAASIRLAGGGSAANTACWLGAAGVPVRLVAAMGDDALGAMVRDDLGRFGVEVQGPVVADAPTGTCVVLVDGSGERSMLPDRGANDHLDEQSVRRAVAAGPGWVHLSAYTLLHPGSRPAGIAAIADARGDGIGTSVDLASREPLRAAGATTVQGWLEGVDVVFANEGELDAVGGLEALLGRVGAVVVKRGARGARWCDGVTSQHEASPEVVVADTTGAGDALAAGWIAARRSGAAADVALRAAVVLGSQAVSGPGARPAGPGVAVPS